MPPLLLQDCGQNADVHGNHVQGRLRLPRHHDQQRKACWDARAWGQWDWEGGNIGAIHLLTHLSHPEAMHCILCACRWRCSTNTKKARSASQTRSACLTWSRARSLAGRTRRWRCRPQPSRQCQHFETAHQGVGTEAEWAAQGGGADGGPIPGPCMAAGTGFLARFLALALKNWIHRTGEIQSLVFVWGCFLIRALFNLVLLQPFS